MERHLNNPDVDNEGGQNGGRSDNGGGSGDGCDGGTFE